MATRILLACALMVALWLPATAQSSSDSQSSSPSPSTPPASPPPGCTADEHRQFDFWVGDWEVRGPNGGFAGTNKIDSTLDGCVLHENWVGAQGSLRGESFNIYSEGEWRQVWVDTSGRVLDLRGGLQDGKMVLSGSRKAQDGSAVIDKVSWELLEDGRVKQHWRVSRDGGESWQDAFVGFYSKS